MNWKQLISAKRFGMEEFHEEQGKTARNFNRTMTASFFPHRSADCKTKHRYSRCPVVSSYTTD